MLTTMSFMSTSTAVVEAGGLRSVPRLHTSNTPIRLNKVRCEAGKPDSLRSLRKAVHNTQEVLDKNTKGDCVATEELQGNVEGIVNRKREVVDKTTKEDLTKDIILRNQDQDHSNKRSFFGVVPSSESFFTRPEIERRPETGDRSFGNLFSFDGAAPETINGRLAMLGFVWALAAEKATGLTVLEQVFNPSVFGLVNFVGVTQLFTFASLIPFMMGESTDARHWGIFNAKAERWNGRLAMVGFAALIIDEVIRGSPFLSCFQNWLPGQ